MLDFIHLGVRHSASVMGSTNAPGTFRGSLCAGTTRKKSPSFEEHNHLLLAVGVGPADTLAKGHPQKVRLQSPESGLFRSTATSLPRSEHRV
jgi:hypothetical protein